MRWQFGDAIVRREVLNDGRPWTGGMVRVVEDTDDQLVTFIPTGTMWDFPAGTWPTDDGLHPWDNGDRRWFGHGTLMVQRPKESWAIWHFWAGDDRQFIGWYVNLQEPFRRHALGYDTQDLELDLVVLPDRTWHFKDADVMEQRIDQGRFTREQVDEIFALGDRVAARLDAGEELWDPVWSHWEPPTDWTPVEVPSGWADLPTPLQ